MGWHYVCRVRGGTGFVSTGSSDTFGDRLARTVIRPEVVIIEGGGNDNRHPHDLVEQAARETLTRTREHLPKARIVLLGPLALHRQDRPRMAALGQHLAAAAAAANVEHIDASGWFAEGADGLVTADRVHPNEKGAGVLAERIVRALH
jgi:lysophospholipase L1-like esterase